MLDKYSGHLFVTDEDGVYMRAQEKGWMFPTESTLEEPLAGNIPHLGNITPQSIQLNNFKKTPEAESTRDQIPTSTPSRAIREILDQRSGKSPQLKGSRESTPKPKTVAQLLTEKRGHSTCLFSRTRIAPPNDNRAKRVRKEGPTTGTGGSRG